MEIKPLSMRRIFSVILSVFLLITALAMPVNAAPKAKTNKISITGTADYKAAFDILKIVNAERKKVGRPALVMDKATMEAAMQRAAECAVYYSHIRPDGSAPFTVLEWDYSVGENIAAGYKSAKDVMTAWMNSPGHKVNIVDDYYYVTKESHHRFMTVGIGAFKVNDIYYWCQLFSGSQKQADPTQKKAVSKTFTVSVKSSNLHLSLEEKKISLDGGKSTTIKINNINKPFYEVSTLLSAKGFTYSSSNTAVATVNTAGKVTGVGAGSAKITVKCKNGYTLFTIPVTVKNEIVKATLKITAKGITVSWGKVTGATTYKIYKSIYKNGKWQKATLAKSTGSLSYTDSKAKSGEKVRYTVYAYAGKKEFKSNHTVTGMYLAQPKIKLTKATKGVKITWSKVAGATSYKVYRSVYKNGKWSAYAAYSNPTGTSYTDKNVKSGQKVRYTVYAVNGSYKSAEKTGVSIKH